MIKDGTQRAVAKPVVVLSIGPADVDQDSVAGRLRSFTNADDVYSPEFGKTLILQNADERLNERFLKQLRCSELFDDIILLSSDSCCTEELPAGPYFLRDNKIYQVWRLYCDELDSFMVTLIPNRVSHHAG